MLNSEGGKLKNSQINISTSDRRNNTVRNSDSSLDSYPGWKLRKLLPVETNIAKCKQIITLLLKKGTFVIEIIFDMQIKDELINHLSGVWIQASIRSNNDAEYIKAMQGTIAADCLYSCPSHQARHFLWILTKFGHINIIKQYVPHYIVRKYFRHLPVELAVKYGQLAALKYFFELRDAYNYNYLKREHYNLLNLALDRGYVEIADLIIELYLRVTAESRRKTNEKATLQPISRLLKRSVKASNGKLVAYLLQRKRAAIDNARIEDKYDVLDEAISKGLSKSVAALLDNGLLLKSHHIERLLADADLTCTLLFSGSINRELFVDTFASANNQDFAHALYQASRDIANPNKKILAIIKLAAVFRDNIVLTANHWALILQDTDLAFYLWLTGWVNVADIKHALDSHININEHRAKFEQGNSLLSKIKKVEDFVIDRIKHNNENQADNHQQKIKISNIEVLPDEVLLLIYQYIGGGLSTVSHLNQNLRRLCHDSIYWSSLFQQLYGFKPNILLPGVQDKAVVLKINYAKLFAIFSNITIFESFYVGHENSEVSVYPYKFVYLLDRTLRHIRKTISNEDQLGSMLQEIAKNQDISLLQSVVFFIRLNKLIETIIKLTAGLAVDKGAWLVKQLIALGLNITPDLFDLSLRHGNIHLIRYIFEKFDKDITVLNGFYGKDGVLRDFVFHILNQVLDSKSCLESAKSCVKYFIVDLGLQVYLNPKDHLELLRLVDMNDFMMIKYLLLSDKRYLAEGDSQQHTVLHQFILQDQSYHDILTLLHYGADPQIKTFTGKTSYQLFCAAKLDKRIVMIGLLTGELFADDKIAINSKRVIDLILEIVDNLIKAIISGGRFAPVNGKHCLSLLKYRLDSDVFSQENRIKLITMFYKRLTHWVESYLQMDVCDDHYKPRYSECNTISLASFAFDEAGQARATKDLQASPKLNFVYQMLLIDKARTIRQIAGLMKLMQTGNSFNSHSMCESFGQSFSYQHMDTVSQALMIMAKIQLALLTKQSQEGNISSRHRNYFFPKAYPSNRQTYKNTAYIIYDDIRARPDFSEGNEAINMILHPYGFMPNSETRLLTELKAFEHDRAVFNIENQLQAMQDLLTDNDDSIKPAVFKLKCDLRRKLLRTIGYKQIAMNNADLTLPVTRVKF